jgi:hypothetical protein
MATDDAPAPRSASQSPPPPRAPFLTRFGATVCVAALAALLASAPGALRMGGTGEIDSTRAWLTLAGLAIAPMLVLVPIARLARDGLRGYFGPGALERVTAALVFACTWLWTLTVVGALLRAKTHHRALGGATFALIALATAIFLALTAQRLGVIVASVRTRRGALGVVIAALAVGLSLVLLGLRIARAAPHLPPLDRATLVDGIAFALGLAFVARRSFDDRRVLARIGPPVAVCLIAVSMHALVTSPAAVEAMQRAAPVHFALLNAFARTAF